MLTPREKWNEGRRRAQRNSSLGIQMTSRDWLSWKLGKLRRSRFVQLAVVIAVLSGLYVYRKELFGSRISQQIDAGRASLLQFISQVTSSDFSSSYPGSFGNFDFQNFPLSLMAIVQYSCAGLIGFSFFKLLVGRNGIRTPREMSGYVSDRWSVFYHYFTLKKAIMLAAGLYGLMHYSRTFRLHEDVLQIAVIALFVTSGYITLNLVMKLYYWWTSERCPTCQTVNYLSDAHYRRVLDRKMRLGHYQNSWSDSRGNTFHRQTPYLFYEEDVDYQMVCRKCGCRWIANRSENV